MNVMQPRGMNEEDPHVACEIPSASSRDTRHGRRRGGRCAGPRTGAASWSGCRCCWGWCRSAGCCSNHCGDSPHVARDSQLRKHPQHCHEDGILPGHATSPLTRHVAQAHAQGTQVGQVADAVGDGAAQLVGAQLTAGVRRTCPAKTPLSILAEHASWLSPRRPLRGPTHRCCKLVRLSMLLGMVPLSWLLLKSLRGFAIRRAKRPQHPPGTRDIAADTTCCAGPRTGPTSGSACRCCWGWCRSVGCCSTHCGGSPHVPSKKTPQHPLGTRVVVVAAAAAARAHAQGTQVGQVADAVGDGAAQLVVAQITT